MRELRNRLIEQHSKQPHLGDDDAPVSAHVAGGHDLFEEQPRPQLCQGLMSGRHHRRRCGQRRLRVVAA